MIREQDPKFKNTNSVWTKRFMVAAVIQGAVVVGLTFFFVLGQISYLKPEVSRVMAAGSAGTWLTFGYVMYIIVGVIGVAVSALFYHYLEGMMSRSLGRSGSVLAWIHLLLMNFGTAAAMGMLMYAGYIGGAAMLPENVGGKGLNAAEAHEVLGPFTEPISIAILVILVGVMAGGLSFVVTYMRPNMRNSARKDAGGQG
jgi:hypothetical protein